MSGGPALLKINGQVTVIGIICGYAVRNRDLSATTSLAQIRSMMGTLVVTCDDDPAPAPPKTKPKPKSGTDLKDRVERLESSLTAIENDISEMRISISKMNSDLDSILAKIQILSDRKLTKGKDGKDGLVTVIIKQNDKELYRLKNVKPGSKIEVPVETYTKPKTNE